VVKRWPIILTGVIDHLHNLNHDLSLKAQSVDDASATEFREKISEGTGVIERISKLKYEMGRDKPLEYVTPTVSTLVHSLRPQHSSLGTSKTMESPSCNYIMMNSRSYRHRARILGLRRRGSSLSAFRHRLVEPFSYTLIILKSNLFL
jgi:hypothetical protein